MQIVFLNQMVIMYQTHYVNGEANKMFIWSSQLESDDGFRIECSL